jgi:streptomycin 3"-adenylyltransferase
MWRTSVTGEFVSKDVAANWAATRLPAEQAAVLVNAREAYLSGCKNDWQNRRQELQLTVSSLQDCILTNL